MYGYTIKETKSQAKKGGRGRARVPLIVWPLVEVNRPMFYLLCFFKLKSIQHNTGSCTNNDSA